MRLAQALIVALLPAALSMATPRGFGVACAQAPVAAPAWPAPTPAPERERELTVTNRGRRPIVELYASPGANDSWGQDRLGEQTLEPGRSARIRLGRGRECGFDVQALYEDASREEQHGVDVCRGRALTFDGSAAVASPRGASPLHEVVVANRSSRPIQQVLISASDAADWGDDRLGNASISVGEAATVRFQGGCVADIRVVFDNRSAEERRGADLCAARRIAIQPGWTTADTLPSEREPGSEAMLLGVVNRSGHPATGLFLYPAGGADRGPELLGGRPLQDGARIEVGLLRPAGQCAFAAYVVYGGKRPDAEVPGLDLCQSTEVTLPGRG